MVHGVTSRCTSTLVRSGSASLPTNTRMRRMAAIEPRATTVMASSMIRSRQPLLRRSERAFERSPASGTTRVVGWATRSGLGQGIVADDFDDLLSVRALDPVDEPLGQAGRGARRVEVEKPGNRVRAVLRRLERGRDRGRRVVFLDVERADPLEIRDAPVADPEGVALDGAHDRRSARKGLHARGEVFVLKNVLLEVAVGPRVVLPAVKDDGVIGPADVFPRSRVAGVDLVQLRNRDLLEGTLGVDVHGERVQGDLRFHGGRAP